MQLMWTCMLAELVSCPIYSSIHDLIKPYSLKQNKRSPDCKLEQQALTQEPTTAKSAKPKISEWMELVRIPAQWNLRGILCWPYPEPEHSSPHHPILTN
jgi:hypothetical protein